MTTDRLRAMCRHFLNTTEEEKYWGRPDVCGYRDDFSNACHTNYGLEMRMKNMHKGDYRLFWYLVSFDPN